MPVLTNHIRLDESGVAWIDDTNTKVAEVAMDMVAHGWSPEEIHFQHPHFSMAQIHSALGYYYDHKAEMDARIEHDAAEVERLRSQAGELPLASVCATWANWRERRSLHGCPCAGGYYAWPSP